MQLRCLVDDPFRALMYLERYVNNGSPSGFTEIHRTKGPTDPFSDQGAFQLLCVQADPQKFFDFGHIPDDFVPRIDLKCDFFVHPDLRDHAQLKNSDQLVTVASEFLVSPTSSCRTVQVVDRQAPYYIKLHYDGVIGRFNRSLLYRKAVAGPEVSAMIEDAIASGTLREAICILPEHGARMLRMTENDDDSWGMVVRAYQPVGANATKVKFLIPYFSLFSRDRMSVSDAPLLTQLLDCQDHPPVEYLLDRILFPILKCYLELVIKLGLQLELNAQNILIALDEHLDVISIVVRDLMGTRKDLGIRLVNELPTVFAAGGYRVIAADMILTERQVLHSIGYDFKLGEYVFEPIVRLASRYYDLPKLVLRQRVALAARKLLKNLPSDYLPADSWYVKPRMMHAKPDSAEIRYRPRYR